MITPEQILDKLNEQNLLTKFRGEYCENNLYHLTFEKFALVDNVRNVVNYINLADGLINRPVSYITYDAMSNELLFNIHFYNKADGQLTWITKSTESIKWMNVVQNKYILSFPFGSRVGNMLNQKLQAIDKIL